MRTAVLVSAPVAPDLRQRIADDQYPQQDFIALAEALDADLVVPIPASARPRGKLANVLGLLRATWAAFQQREMYDLIITDVDREGMLLALLLKLVGSKKRHILICHGKVARPFDLRLIRAFRLHSHIHRFVCYGPAVAQKLRESLRLSPGRVLVVRHAADHGFWRPLPVPTERLVVSAGMLHRDYATLVEAVRDLDVEVVIAASSPWVVASPDGLDREALPQNVRITKCSYDQLRGLYARALLVAIPLEASGAQSGSLVMYEAMAMGKAVVATKTEGQIALEVMRDGETGLYVPEGDAAAWQGAIRHLCDHPETAAQMGQKARAAVESGLNMDAYVQDMVAIVRSVAAESGPTGVPGRLPTKAST